MQFPGLKDRKSLREKFLKCASAIFRVGRKNNKSIYFFKTYKYNSSVNLCVVLESSHLKLARSYMDGVTLQIKINGTLYLSVIVDVF